MSQPRIIRVLLPGACSYDFVHITCPLVFGFKLIAVMLPRLVVTVAPESPTWPPNVPWVKSNMLPKLIRGTGPPAAVPMLHVPGGRVSDMFQSYADGRLALTVPEYQAVGLKAVPVIVPNTLEEFHCISCHLGFVVVPRLVRMYFRYSPAGPATLVPEGTLVTFKLVSTPVRGSYPRHVVPEVAINKPFGRTPCWLGPS